MYLYCCQSSNSILRTKNKNNSLCVYCSMTRVAVVDKMVPSQYPQSSILLFFDKVDTWGELSPSHIHVFFVCLFFPLVTKLFFFSDMEGAVVSVFSVGTLRRTHVYTINKNLYVVQYTGTTDDQSMQKNKPKDVTVKPQKHTQWAVKLHFTFNCTYPIQVPGLSIEELDCSSGNSTLCPHKQLAEPHYLSSWSVFSFKSYWLLLQVVVIGQTILLVFSGKRETSHKVWLPRIFIVRPLFSFLTLARA